LTCDASDTRFFTAREFVHLMKILCVITPRAQSRAGIRYDTKHSCSRDARECTNSYVIIATQSRQLQLDKLERTDTRARFPGSRLRAFRVCTIVYRINPPNAPCILSTYTRQIFCNIFRFLLYDRRILVLKMFIS